MTTIGRLNYQIGMDTANFAKGSVLTRREMQLVRRELRASVTPTEEVGEKVDALAKAFEEGAIDLEQYGRSFTRLTAGLPEAKAAQEAHSAAVTEAARITKQFASPQDQYAERIGRLDELLADAHISQETYNAAAAEAAQVLPEVRAAADAEAKAIADASKLTAAAAGPAERYNAEVARAAQLLDSGKISQETYNHAVAEAGKKLPEVAEAERQLARDMQAGEAIKRRNETEAEGYGRQMRDLKRMLDVGALSERDYAREAKRIKNELPSVQREQRELNDAIQEGRNVTRSLMTAEERRGAEIRKLRGLLDRGMITQTTYNRGVAAARREQLAQIPVLGRVAGGFASVHPAVIGATVAIGGFVIGARAAIGVARALSAAVGEQLAEVDQLAKSSAKLGASVDDLFVFGEAARELSGFDFSKTETAIQRMTRRVAEAAVGTGEARAAIKELGHDAQQLNLAGPINALGMFADAFAAIDDEGTRLRLAFKLFDSEGVGLINTLSIGSDQLAEYRAKMEALGAIPTPFDAEAAKETNDAFKDVGLVLDGLARDLTSNIAPTLVAIAKEVTDALKPGSAIGEQIRIAFVLIPPAIGAAADATNYLIGGFEIAAAGAMQVATRIVQGMAVVDRAVATATFSDPNAALQAMDSASGMILNNAERIATDGAKRMTDAWLGTIQERAEKIGNDLHSAAAVDDQTINIEANLAGLEAAEALRKDADDLTASLLTQIDTFGLSQREVKVLALEQEAARVAAMAIDDATRDEAESLRLAADEARALADELTAMEAAAKLDAALEKTNASLREQIATAGMSADEVERWKLAQMGATETQLAHIAALQQFADVAQGTAEAQQGVEDLTSSLVEQIETFGMSREEAELWKLAQAGASDTSVETARALSAELKAMREHQKLMKEGEQLTKAMRTPLQEYRDELAHLQEMRDAGAISEETYARAVRKTTDELIRAKNVANEGIDGADTEFEITQRLEQHARFMAGLGDLGATEEPPEVPRSTRSGGLFDFSTPDFPGAPEKPEGFDDFRSGLEVPTTVSKPPDFSTPDFSPEKPKGFDDFRSGLEVPATVSKPPDFSTPDFPPEKPEGFDDFRSGLEVPATVSKPPEGPTIVNSSVVSPDPQAAQLIGQTNTLLAQLVALAQDAELEDLDELTLVRVSS